MSWFKPKQKHDCEYRVFLTGGYFRNNIFTKHFTATCIHCGNSRDIVESVNNIHVNNIDAEWCNDNFTKIINDRIYSKMKVVNKL